MVSSLHCDGQLTESATSKHRLHKFLDSLHEQQGIGDTEKKNPRLEREGGLPLVRMLRVGEELLGTERDCSDQWCFPK